MRCIMLFGTADQPGGFSEVYNITANTVDNAVASMQVLAQTRALILSPDLTIIGFRITTPLVAPGP